MGDEDRACVPTLGTSLIVNCTVTGPPPRTCSLSVGAVFPLLCWAWRWDRVPLAPEAASRPFSPDLRLTPAQDRPVPLGEPAQAPVSPSAMTARGAAPSSTTSACIPDCSARRHDPSYDLASHLLGCPPPSVLPSPASATRQVCPGPAHSPLWLRTLRRCLSPPLLPSQPSPSPTLIPSVVLGLGPLSH